LIRLGLLALPLTGAAAIAIGLGAAVQMMLTLLLVAEVVTGVVAFAVINHRSQTLSPILSAGAGSRTSVDWPAWGYT
jgi:hypothetical protein